MPSNVDVILEPHYKIHKYGESNKNDELSFSSLQLNKLSRNILFGTNGTL